MDEVEFWEELGHAIAAEMAASAIDALEQPISDGAEPQRFLLDSDTPRIEGRQYMLKSHSYFWDVVLLLTHLPQPIRREDLDWDALFPPDGATGWLTVDLAGRTLTVEPWIAEPPEADIIRFRNGSTSVVPLGTVSGVKPPPDVSWQTYLRKVRLTDTPN